jgi:small-conductance mechanosensitive channel
MNASSSSWWDHPFWQSLNLTPAGLVLAVSALAAAWILSKIVQWALMRRVPKDGPDTGVRYSLGRLVHYSLMVLGTLMAIHLLGVDLASIAIVFGALGIGIGFGLQTIVANFVAGLVLLLERPIRVGDRISLGTLDADAQRQINGYVRKIGLRSTTVVTPDNIALIVPNSELITQTVVNWSLGDARMRLRFSIGVAYGTDPDLVRRVVGRVAQEYDEALRDPPAEVRLTATADSSLEFQLLVWIADPRRRGAVESALRERIIRAFGEAGITIPFPQRDVHLIGEPPR